MDIYGKKVRFSFYFSQNGGYLVYYPSNVFANYSKKKCLQKVNCLMCGMFTFQCSLVRFYEQTNMSRSFTTTTKRSLSLN